MGIGRWGCTQLTKKRPLLSRQWGYMNLILCQWACAMPQELFIEWSRAAWGNNILKHYCSIWMISLFFSPSFEAHITRLDLVFSHLGDFGLKVKLSKCSLFQSKVHYLGHVIAEGGVSPDPEKLRAVEAWVTPQNITQLHAFLGLAGYRRFIKDFAQIAAPLNSMLWGTSNR